jgi:hypothetical protein
VVSEEPPSTLQRTPSTNPTAGLNAKNALYFAGIIDEEYTIGVAYSHIWIIKGIAYMKSRYLTFNADNHRLIPTDTVKASSMKNGNINKRHVGVMWYTQRSTISTSKETTMSKTTEPTLANGIMILGK